MSKIIPEQVLIALAKKAPKVEPEPEFSETQGRSKLKENKNDPRVIEFLDLIGVKPGRNHVMIDALLEAFNNYHSNKINITNFRASLKAIYKFYSDKSVKLNMSTITILEKAKEIKHHEKENKKEQI